MADLVRYRVRCTTDSKYEFTAWQSINDAAPTTCPVSGAHTIDSTHGAVLVDRNAIDSIDSQNVDATVDSQTTSTTYVDLPGASITVNNNKSRAYCINFDGVFECSVADGAISIQVLADGTLVAGSERNVDYADLDNRLDMSVNCKTPSLATAKVIKIQWKTSAGTATVRNGALSVQGIA